MAVAVEIDGTTYRVQERPGYLLIYKRSARGQFYRDIPFWNGRLRKPPALGSMAARVLAAYDRKKGGADG